MLELASSICCDVCRLHYHQQHNEWADSSVRCRK